MSCATGCGKPAAAQCSGCKAVTYCGPECQRMHWTSGGHQAACLIEGKNARSEDEEDPDKRKKKTAKAGEKKKPTATARAEAPDPDYVAGKGRAKKKNEEDDEDDKSGLKVHRTRFRERVIKEQQGQGPQLSIVLQTLRSTPQMLENLALGMSLKQLQELKETAGALYRTIWKNSHFWFYVVRRHRPDLLPGGPDGVFDTDYAYKQLAMRRIVAPGKTAFMRERRLNTGVTPLMRQALDVVMRNPAALDAMLAGATPEIVSGWATVSRDFHEILHQSNRFWYHMRCKYLGRIGPYDVTFDYKKYVLRNLSARTLLVIDLEIDSIDGAAIRSRMLSQDSAGSDIVHDRANVGFSAMDIVNAGGLAALLSAIDDYEVVMLNMESGQYERIPGADSVWADFGAGLVSEENDWETETDGPPSLEQILVDGSGWENLGEIENVMMLYAESTDVYRIRVRLSHRSPVVFQLVLEYPETVQPVFELSTASELHKESSTPLILGNPIRRITQRVSFFMEEERYFEGTDLMDLILDFPAYLIQRGEVGTQLNDDEWVLTDPFGTMTPAGTAINHASICDWLFEHRGTIADGDEVVFSFERAWSQE